jgi:inorganic pyrophosphatase
MRVLVEAESGSCEKNMYDKRTLACKGTQQVSRPYPFPYGFVTGTTTTDGDGVDCYIITKDRIAAGSIVECEAIGLLEQLEDGKVDYKVLAALPGQNTEIGEELLCQLRDFIYAIFAEYPDTKVSVGRILSRQAALDHIQRSEGD